MDKLNPGYKFLFLLLVSLILSFTYKIWLNLTVFLVCILATALTSSVNKKRMLLGMLPFALTAAGMYMSGMIFPAEGGEYTGSWGLAYVSATSMTSAVQLSTRVLAFGGIGILFALTTDPEEFAMSLMRQFHLPPKFAYGLLAAYHFFPVVRNEYDIVRAALKVRGVKAPLFSSKCLVPMLVHAFKRSESIAMAMESRGFYSEGERGDAFSEPELSNFIPKDLTRINRKSIR